MIPNFKTFIKESIWSDIQKRSSGEITRKEDDVNHMDFDVFADYIEEKYSKLVDWVSVMESIDETQKHIYVDISFCIELSFNISNGKLYNILVSTKGYNIDISELKKIFNVNVLGTNTFSILEKNWKKSNNTFVKLIDFFLDMKTNESIWSDIQKRSSGEMTRKEDDINNLGMEELYALIFTKYERIPKVNPLLPHKSQLISGRTYFSIPILSRSYKIYCLDVVFYDDKIKSVALMITEKELGDLKELKQILDDRFRLETRKDGAIDIKSNDGDLTNAVCMDVIQTIIENSQTPLYKKRD